MAQTLPRDLSAERAVLGCVLLSHQAAMTVILDEDLQPSEFFSPLNQQIFAIMRTLFDAGDPIDAVTVHAADTGIEISELLSIQNDTPMVSSAQRYCAVVREMAVRRRLVQFASEISQRAMSGEVTSEEVIASAEATITDVRLASEAVGGKIRGLYLRARDLLPPDWSIDDLNPWVVPGLLRSEETGIIVAGPGLGKALDVDTLIPTPEGFKRMGDLRSGGFVFGSDGRPTEIVAASEAEDLPSSVVELADGASIVAADSHYWGIRRRVSHGPARPLIVQTSDLTPGRDLVPLIAPTVSGEVPLPLDPYVLGCWLGDGHAASARVTLFEDDQVDISLRFAAAGWTLERRSAGHGIPRRSGLFQIKGDRYGAFMAALDDLGLRDGKRIPRRYLEAGTIQRLELLRGLLDTDSHVTPVGAVEFCSTTQNIAEGVIELLSSLGYKSTITESDATLNGRCVGPRWRVTFRGADLGVGLPFHTERRRSACMTRPADLTQIRVNQVRAVNPVGIRRVRCIQVGAPDGLFAAGPRYTLTHNSTILRQAAFTTENSLHWLSGYGIRGFAPKRGLIIECESRKHNVAQSNVMLRHGTARHLGCSIDDISEPAVLMNPGRFDVRDPSTRSRVIRVLREVKPDLVCVGPLKNMLTMRPGETYEGAATATQHVWDDLKSRFGFALLIESHSNRSDPGNVAGSARWADWPDFGFSLQVPDKDAVGGSDVEMDLVRFRADRNTEIRLPTQIIRAKRGAYLPMSCSFEMEREYYELCRSWPHSPARSV